jgi:hypothetical protein
MTAAPASMPRGHPSLHRVHRNHEAGVPRQSLNQGCTPQLLVFGNRIGLPGREIRRLCPARRLRRRADGSLGQRVVELAEAAAIAEENRA